MKTNFLTLFALGIISTATYAQEIKSTNPIKIQYAEPKIETQQTEPAEIKVETNPISQKKGFSLKGLQLGAGLGALGGANFQLGYRFPQSSENFFKNRFGFRLDYNTWSPLKNYIEDYFEEEPIKIDDNELSIILKGKQFGALIDIYPFGNTWALGNIRLSAGYYTGDFSLGGLLSKEANEIFSIDAPNSPIETFYKVNGTANLTATFDYDVKGPYAGLGFDIGLLFGLKMYFDAGLVFTDKPTINTDITGSGTITICDDETCASGTNVQIDDILNPQIQKLLDDTKAQYEDELDKLRKGYFPIIKLGLLYRF